MPALVQLVARACRKRECASVHEALAIPDQLVSYGPAHDLRPRSHAVAAQRLRLCWRVGRAGAERAAHLVLRTPRREQSLKPRPSRLSSGPVPGLRQAHADRSQSANPSRRHCAGEWQNCVQAEQSHAGAAQGQAAQRRARACAITKDPVDSGSNIRCQLARTGRAGQA